jgi:ribosomal protein L28
MAKFSIKYKRVGHIGNNVSHAKNRTKKAFLRNLHKATIIAADGVKRRVLVPTKILRMLRKQGLTTHWKGTSA